MKGMEEISHKMMRFYFIKIMKLKIKRQTLAKNTVYIINVIKKAHISICKKATFHGKVDEIHKELVPNSTTKSH